MPHPLDMCGAVTIPSERLAIVGSIERLAEALRLETIDHVQVSSDMIDIRIDPANRLRPGGDGWMFNVWDHGQFQLIERDASTVVRFTLRTSWAIPTLLLGVVLVILAAWWMLMPPLVISLSLFVWAVVLSVLWTRYISFPRWLRRVLTSSTLTSPRRLKEMSSGSG
ncbi:MAG: hypothetical protein AB7L36_15065 [Sphingomonadaceae bacterium]